MEQNFEAILSSTQQCYVMIDYYNQQNPIGKLFHESYGIAEFCSLTTLIRLIEKITGEENNNARQFIPFSDMPDEVIFVHDDLNTNQKYGNLATFRISVLFTQRNSWQGIISWVEENKAQCFRSVYELIRLIDNAVSYTKYNREASRKQISEAGE